MGNIISSNTEPVANDTVVISENLSTNSNVTENDYETTLDNIKKEVSEKNKKLLKVVDPKNILDESNYRCCNCTYEGQDPYYIQKAERIYKYKEKFYPFCRICFLELYGENFRMYETHGGNTLTKERYENIIDRYVVKRWNESMGLNCRPCFVDKEHPVEKCICPGCYNRGTIRYSTKVCEYSWGPSNVPACDYCESMIRDQHNYGSGSYGLQSGNTMIDDLAEIIHNSNQ